MRTYKFRLSEIIPNAWFYKLKEMGNKTTTTPNKKKHINQTSSSSFSLSTTTTTAHSDHRKSYHISRDLTAPPKTREPPQKSAKKRHNKPPSPRRVASSVSTTPVTSPETSTSGPDHRSDETLSCGCSNDTTIFPSPKLPPIITKTPTKTEKTEEKTGEKTEGKKQRIRPVRRYSGLKLRAKSPRIQGRKSVSSQSFAVVKTSRDPHRDFRESMVEMIVENNIRASKDLEDLLACYLSLNSDEYHDLIIKVFKQIWFDVFMNVRLN